MGPMTGRAAGYCAGYPAPGFANPIPGRGAWGWGRGGGGWGRRNWFHATGLTGWQRAAYGGYPPVGGAAPYGAPYAAPGAPVMTAQQELDGLKGQAEYFEEALSGIKKRIEEMEAKAQDK